MEILVMNKTVQKSIFIDLILKFNPGFAKLRPDHTVVESQYIVQELILSLY